MTCPAAPFTLRELARKAHWFCLCQGRGNLLGVDMDEVRAARLATIVGAQRAVEAALQGPPRCLYSEADDASLEQMAAYLVTRRAELERA